MDLKRARQVVVGPSPWVTLVGSFGAPFPPNPFLDRHVSVLA
jgi:hypothetical protein